MGNTEKAEESLDEEITQAIAQIKQAFADENYLQVPETVMDNDGWIDVRYAKKVLANGVPLMTGAEWYDRFRLALPNGWYLDDEVVEAAKKASGLE